MTTRTISTTAILQGQPLANYVPIGNLILSLNDCLIFANGLQDGIFRLKDPGAPPSAGKTGSLYSYNNVLYYDNGTLIVNVKPINAAVFVISGTLTTGLKNPNFYSPIKAVIDKVYIHVVTAPTGDELIVDVHKNGTTIFTDQGKRPEIAIAGLCDESSTPDVTALAVNDILTVYVDQIGSTIAGADLTVQVRMKAVI